jgi:hypothetical protein
MKLLQLAALVASGILIAEPGFAGGSLPPINPVSPVINVAEPASIALLAAGIGALAGARHFRKRK